MKNNVVKVTDYSISLSESQIIKGFAICAMLWHHLFLDHREYGQTAFSLALTGKICVALFVFISGYGMTIQYEKTKQTENTKINLGQIVKYLAKRYAKFYLNYWVIFCITVPLGVLVFNRSLDDAYGLNCCIVKNFVMDFWGLLGTASYNITWWFNRLILVLWLLFPMFYWCMKRKIVAIMVLILLYFNPDGVLDVLKFMDSKLPTYAVVYAVGIFMAVHKDRINKCLNKIDLIIMMPLLLLVTVGLLYIRNHYTIPCFFGYAVDPFVAIFLSLSVVALCRHTNRKLHFFEYLGRHSMNIYMIHTFIFFYFFSDIVYAFKYSVLIFLSLLLSSLLFSVGIEYLKKIWKFYWIQEKILVMFK